MPDTVDWRAMEREASPGRAVGRLLKDQREARGLSVIDIEKRLKIRKNHVEAIEAGRFDLLPGAAYIPAFLRAYAAHVGLDSEKVLNAYQASGPVPIKRPVALPADFPIVEKRAPIGLAVLTVLLVVGAGYGVWRYLPHPQSVVAEKVPPVPDRLLASTPKSEPGTPAIAMPTQQAAVPTTTTTQTSVATPVPAAAPAAPAPAAPAPAAIQASVAAQPAPQPAPPIVVTVPAPPPPVVMSATSVGQAQAAQPAVEAPQAQPPQEARAAQPEAAQPQQSLPPQAAAVSLPTKVDTPIQVRANSWVELRAPNGDILAMTYVRAGESYTVPAGIAYRVIDAR